MRSYQTKSISLICIVFFILLNIGCFGKTETVYKLKGNDGGKDFVFPNGTILGSASNKQAIKLAEIFVNSHNECMAEVDHIDKSIENLLGKKEALIDESIKRVDENLRTAQKSLNLLEKVSKNQGTGEITILFPTSKASLAPTSLEYIRLVQFLDYVARESKGREVLFISIGSASAFGDKRLNKVLAQKRADFPTDAVNKFLVNIPHKLYSVYGIGDTYSPKNATYTEHQNYQHTRIIAVFSTNQIPLLPKV